MNKARKYCKISLKYSFELFLLKCIFEFIINIAPQDSNSVNGREKYFNTINFTVVAWPSGQKPYFFSLGEVGRAGSIPGVASSSFFFFFFIVFLPFDILLFILTADPV